jgi:hypothetical protein
VSRSGLSVRPKRLRKEMLAELPDVVVIIIIIDEEEERRQYA